MPDLRKAIAVDFDGCLCSDAWPEIGAPNWDVIIRARQEQQAGAGLILWTCREGELLNQAVEACARWGLQFDAINESLPEWVEFYGNQPRKVGATEYWDDKGVPMPDPAVEAAMLDDAEVIMGRAITTWGPETQLTVALEELSELQKEICKCLRGSNNLDALSEEMADVEIMLAQLRMMFGNGESVEAWKARKLERLDGRIRAAEVERRSTAEPPAVGIELTLNNHREREAIV